MAVETVGEAVRMLDGKSISRDEADVAHPQMSLSLALPLLFIIKKGSSAHSLKYTHTSHLIILFVPSFP